MNMEVPVMFPEGVPGHVPRRGTKALVAGVESIFFCFWKMTSFYEK